MQLKGAGQFSAWHINVKLIFFIADGFSDSEDCSHGTKVIITHDKFICSVPPTHNVFQMEPEDKNK